MSYIRFTATVFMCFMVFSIVSCKSKTEKTGAGTASSQEKIIASPQDTTDAKSAALHVLSQYVAGEFSQIYKESAPVFKQFGSEADFIAQFQQTLKESGAIKNPKESKFEARPDKTFVLSYRMDNEHFNTDVNLTFVRSSNGKMELAGIHQHDEPIKK